MNLGRWGCDKQCKTNDSKVVEDSDLAYASFFLAKLLPLCLGLACWAAFFWAFMRSCSR